MTPDIDTPEGTRIRPLFVNGAPQGGTERDNRKVMQYLMEGMTYTVEGSFAGDDHTEVFLKEVPQEDFNINCFVIEGDPLHESDLTDVMMERLAMENVPSLDKTEVGRAVTTMARGFYKEALRLGRDRGLFATSALIDAGWKCMNATMVLSDRYRADGDKENADMCKRVAEEWRSNLIGRRVWTTDEVREILKAAEKQVENMTDGKLIPDFSSLADKLELK